MKLGLAPCALVTLVLTSACGDAKSVASDDGEVLYPVPDWREGDARALGFDRAALTKLAEVADGNDSHCLVVTRKGQIAGEWYWDGWDARSEQVVFSVTKSFTSTLVGLAQADGKLGLDEPASKYIAEWVGTDSASVTIRDLISNTSGRHWDFVTDYLSMAGSAADKTAFAIGLGQDQPRATYWEYNNSAIQTLERVLEQATGSADVAEYARARLFEPLGMRSSMSHDQAGNTELFEGLHASCRDLARFGYLFLRKGQWEGGAQLVPAAWVDEATRPASELNSAYGYLWWLNQPGHYVLPSAPARNEGDGPLLPKAPLGAFAALGLGGQLIVVDPEHELVMTRIGGSASPVSALASGGDPAGTEIVRALSNALADALRD